MGRRRRNWDGEAAAQAATTITMTGAALRTLTQDTSVAEDLQDPPAPEDGEARNPE